MHDLGRAIFLYFVLIISINISCLGFGLKNTIPYLYPLSLNFMELPPRVRGMQDIFGEYQRYFTFLKKVARHEFRTNGFTRITTPILEMKSLIVHSTGDSSDIVTKEMFDFTDK
jgi:hypothetical protein